MGLNPINSRWISLVFSNIEAIKTIYNFLFFSGGGSYLFNYLIWEVSLHIIISLLCSLYIVRHKYFAGEFFVWQWTKKNFLIDDFGVYFYLHKFEMQPSFKWFPICRLTNTHSCPYCIYITLYIPHVYPAITHYTVKRKEFIAYYWLLW